MSQTQIQWDEITALKKRLEEPGVGPSSVPESEWVLIENTLDTLVNEQDWEGIIRLREIFTGLIARETIAVYPLLRRLTREAIGAAEKIGDKKELAHLLGAEGHNLHRQGYHQEAIRAFDQSAKLYAEAGDNFESLKNTYMTSLCYRALGDRAKTLRILEKVLEEVDEDNPWRGQPLQVMAWLIRDEGDLNKAEELLRMALELHKQTTNPEIIIAGTLADIGEVVGMQNRGEEAKVLFEQSLQILDVYAGQYNRQEARTKIKLAELTMYEGDFSRTLRLLDEAEDSIRGVGQYYDLMWRIELARAYVFYKQRKWGLAIRKMRAVIVFRRELGLPNNLLAKQIVSRLLGKKMASG